MSLSNRNQSVDKKEESTSKNKESKNKVVALQNQAQKGRQVYSLHPSQVQRKKSATLNVSEYFVRGPQSK